MTAFNKKEFIIGGLLAGLFVLGGMGLLIWGLSYYASAKTFLANASEAKGTVTGFDRWEGATSSHSDDIRYAIIVFKTADGKEVRFKGPSQEWASSYKSGDAVEVLYDPKNPDNAKIDSFMGLWFAPAMLCGVGFFAVFIPLLTLYTYLRSCRQ